MSDPTNPFAPREKPSQSPASVALTFCRGFDTAALTGSSLAQVTGMLARCAEKFRLYERMDQDKGTAEGFRKAETNAQMALGCERLLSRLTPKP